MDDRLYVEKMARCLIRLCEIEPNINLLSWFSIHLLYLRYGCDIGEYFVRKLKPTAIHRIIGQTTISEMKDVLGSVQRSREELSHYAALSGGQSTRLERVSHFAPLYPMDGEDLLKELVARILILKIYELGVDCTDITEFQYGTPSASEEAA